MRQVKCASFSIIPCSVPTLLTNCSAGYEADVERHSVDQGESCDGEGVGGLPPMNLPSSPYVIPSEVLQRLWTVVPLEHCIHLLRETLKGGINKNRWVWLDVCSVF